MQMPSPVNKTPTDHSAYVPLPRDQATHHSCVQLGVFFRGDATKGLYYTALLLSLKGTWVDVIQLDQTHTC